MASQRPRSLARSGGKTHTFVKLDISGTKYSWATGSKSSTEAGQSIQEPSNVYGLLQSLFHSFFFHCSDYPWALHTENSVQKMLMQLKGKAKLKTLVLWIKWFPWKQIRKHGSLKIQKFNFFIFICNQYQAHKHSWHWSQGGLLHMKITA